MFQPPYQNGRPLAKSRHFVQRLRHPFAPVAAGIALRLLGVWLARDLGAHTDEREYLDLAAKWLQEGAYPTTFRPPGYVAFLALLQDFTGAPILPARILQALLGGVAIALIRRWGAELAGAEAGILAAWCFALDPTAIAYTHYLYNPAVLWPGLALLGIGLTRWAGAPDPRRGLAIGVLLGGMALVQSYFVMLAVWLAGGALLLRRVGLPAAGSLALGAALVVAPWSAAATLRAGRFVLIDTNGGRNVWVSNRESPPPAYDWGWGGLDDAGGKEGLLTNSPGKLARQRESLRTEARRMAELGRRGGRFILRKPVLFLARVPGKWAHLMSPTSMLVEYLHRGYYGEVPRLWLRLLCGLVVLSAFALPTAAILGLTLGRSPARWTQVLFVTFFFAQHGVIFGMSRFRLPLLPLMCVLAGVWLSGQARWEAASRAGRRWCAGLLGALWLGALTHLTVNWRWLW